MYDLSPLKFIHPHKINSFTFKKLKYGKTLDYDAKKNKVIPDGVFQSKTNIVQTELVLKYNRQIQLMEVPKKIKCTIYMEILYTEPGFINGWKLSTISFISSPVLKTILKNLHFTYPNA